MTEVSLVYEDIIRFVWATSDVIIDVFENKIVGLGIKKNGTESR